MQGSDAQTLVNMIGSLVQLGSAIFLASLFFVLGGAAARRTYFRLWGWGWIAMCAALIAVASRSALVPSFAQQLMKDHSPQLAWLLVSDLWAKLMFAALVVGGARSWVAGFDARRALPIAAVIALIYATLVIALMPAARWIITAQAPVLIAAFAASAWMLLVLPASRRSLGTRVTGVVLAAAAAQWLLYLIVFGRGDPSPASRGGVLSFVFYSSYLDVMMQTLLGYGMVLLFTESGKRETDDAHAELAVAHSDLLRESLYDPLTGALNRRAFQDGVGLESVKAGFGAVIVVDADNLKDVNDRRGHPAGDALLRHLVGTLRAGMRATDRAYRWGGDEFVLLFPGMTSAMASARVEALLAAASPVPLPLGRSDERPLVPHASVGAADYAGAEGLDDAIAWADKAMYAKKGERSELRSAKRIA